MNAHSAHAYETPSWWHEVETAPYAHDLFQLLRRLDAQAAPHPRLGRAWSPSDEPVRIGQQPSLAFAPAAVASASTNENAGGEPLPHLSIHGFGLFGPNGPLPLHLTEFARNRLRNHDDPVLCAFADLFHHRLTLLFYRAWADAQPTVSADRDGHSSFDRYIACLAHLGLASLPHGHTPGPHALYGMTGRLVRKARDAHGLQQILAAWLGMPVRVVEWVPQWIVLERQDRVVLGPAKPGARLGGGAMIGAAVRDASSKFEIRVGQLTLEQFRALLPGTTTMNELTSWVRAYVGREFAWDLRLVLAHDAIVPISLGDTTPLGWGSWLGARGGATDTAHSGESGADDFVYSPEHVLAAGTKRRSKPRSSAGVAP
ncbi:type VI secretion system baseplate subunit TssG [Paraburkholderia silviterrae]|uniref:Type VI secretion system baseplate subunit TssG n=1 Tax=Paraburkholderia silviterrae TaxID=2528715 RepID=A0A4V6PJ49_9BURK|nr:type VI secretion system baseplate subunit TssG [Paraburkholderia silviterrae]TDG23804.1 type VI secretion system baseplate subunit TssG [Paraburkholderia silviterrae]